MKILDRYILQRFLVTYFFVVIILVTIICVIDLTEKNEKFVEGGVTAQQILSYYGDFVPFVANLISPITIFIATVFVTAQMASHTEIIAILSGGVSFLRMMVPYFLGAIVVAGLSFYLIGWVIPNSNKTRLEFEAEYLNNPYYFNERDVHMKVAPQSYFYIESYNNHANVGYKVTLEKIVGNEMEKKLSALKIEWLDDSTNKRLWRLKDWELREFNGMEEKITSGEELDTVLNITPKYFSNKRGLYEALTLPELNEYIADLRERGADDIGMYLFEKYFRFASPFTAIILTFIGIVVSARKARGGVGFQIALGFMIAFVFIITLIFSRSFAEVGVGNIFLAAWMPNIIFSIVALTLYRLIPR